MTSEATELRVRAETFRSLAISYDLHCRQMNSVVAMLRLHHRCHGIATGHGDTLGELLREFDWQLVELRKRLHAALEALAKVEG